MKIEDARKILALLTKAEAMLGKKRMSADEKEYAAHLVGRAAEMIDAIVGGNGHT